MPPKNSATPPAPPAAATVPTGSRATLAALVREALGASHGRAKQLIAAGRVRLDGETVFDVALRPPGGARIEFSAHGAPRSRRPLFGPGFRVLHVDELFLVVEKAAGVVTIPTVKERPNDPPLVTRVGAALGLAGHKIKRGLWVVHRIDRSASGLVLFARSPGAAAELRRQFRARRPLREYLAWVEGVPAPRAGALRHRLRDDDGTRRVVSVSGGDDAKDAQLTYVVEAATTSGPRRARVRVRLITGRRNQIRVQFSACGWPLLGDHFYGAKDPGPGRTALHATRLSFDDPRTGASLTFESPPPPDLVALDRRLFG